MGTMIVDGNGVPIQWVDGNNTPYNPPNYYRTGLMPQVLAQGAVPMGIANSGTIATNGTVTLGTALNTTYSGGIWLYFPSTAFASGSAGFYWTVMSSTTVGVVYTSQTSNTPVTGSNSAYTGDTTARTAVTVTVPGGAMGPNGSLRLSAGCQTNNSAGTKTVAALFGASQIIGTTGTTNVAFSINGITTNRNNQALQRTSVYSQLTPTSQGAYTAIDTTTSQSITIRITIAVATDVIVLENWIVEIIPGN